MEIVHFPFGLERLQFRRLRKFGRAAHYDKKTSVLLDLKKNIYTMFFNHTSSPKIFEKLFFPQLLKILLLRVYQAKPKTDRKLKSEKNKIQKKVTR
jgi:hypothetical protein